MKTIRWNFVSINWGLLWFICFKWRCPESRVGSMVLLQLDLCYGCHMNPCWYLWARLPQTMLVFMVYSAIGNHADVHGMCWRQRPSKCPWSMLSQDTMWKSMIRAPAGCKGYAWKLLLQWYQWLQTQLSAEREGHRGFCDKPSHLPPQK